MHTAIDPLCDFVKCPVAAGSGHTQKITLTVPGWAPPGRVSGYAFVTDQANHLVFCEYGNGVVTAA